MVAAGALAAGEPATAAGLTSCSRGRGAGAATTGDEDWAGSGAGKGVATTGAAGSAGAAALAGIWSGAATLGADFLRLSLATAGVSPSDASGFASTAAGSTVLTSARERSSGLAGSADFCGAGAFFSTGGKPSRTGSTRNGVMACAAASPATKPKRPQQAISASGLLREQGIRVEWAFSADPLPWQAESGC